MKRLTPLLLALLLSACTFREHGNACIGATDKEKPGVHYSVSAWNVFLAIIFSETLIIPVHVILFEVKCPDGPEEVPK